MRFLQVAVAASVLTAVSAIDCSAKELAGYNFNAIKGTYSDTKTKDTPPLKLSFTWSIGICQNLDAVKDCPKNSDLCGVTHVQVDGKDVLTEVIGFNLNLQTTLAEYVDDDKKEKGLRVSYKDVNWGDNLVDATIQFVCVPSGSDKENQLQFKRWDGKVFEGEFRTNAACLSEKPGKPSGKPPGAPPGQPPKLPDETGELWGWFTWIFIFMVLFLSIYIVGGAWFQYNKGNAIDFQTALREVLENFVDLLKGLPLFFREIVEKVTGNLNRGEYSAV